MALKGATVAGRYETGTAAPEARAGDCVPSRSDGTTRLVLEGFQGDTSGQPRGARPVRGNGRAHFSLGGKRRGVGIPILSSILINSSRCSSTALNSLGIASLIS